MREPYILYFIFYISYFIFPPGLRCGFRCRRPVLACALLKLYLVAVLLVSCVLDGRFKLGAGFLGSPVEDVVFIHGPHIVEPLEIRAYYGGEDMLLYESEVISS